MLSDFKFSDACFVNHLSKFTYNSKNCTTNPSQGRGDENFVRVSGLDVYEVRPEVREYPGVVEGELEALGYVHDGVDVISGRLGDEGAGRLDQLVKVARKLEHDPAAFLGFQI